MGLYSNFVLLKIDNSIIYVCTYTFTNELRILLCPSFFVPNQ